jgi:hypothetical protein
VGTTKENPLYVESPYLKINFSHNTVYNRIGDCIVVRNPIQANLDYNALKADTREVRNVYIVSFGGGGTGSLSPDTSTLSYNWTLNTSATAGKGIGDVVSTYQSVFTRTGSLWRKTKDGAADIFQNTANPSIGYLPIDPTVVTNGAGATYSTKLWRTWE